MCAFGHRRLWFGVIQSIRDCDFGKQFHDIPILNTFWTFQYCNFLILAADLLLATTDLVQQQSCCLFANSTMWVYLFLSLPICLSPSFTYQFYKNLYLSISFFILSLYLFHCLFIFPFLHQFILFFFLSNFKKYYSIYIFTFFLSTFWTCYSVRLIKTIFFHFNRFAVPQSPLFRDGHLWDQRCWSIGLWHVHLHSHKQIWNCNFKVRAQVRVTTCRAKA